MNECKGRDCSSHSAPAILTPTQLPTFPLPETEASLRTLVLVLHLLPLTDASCAPDSNLLESHYPISPPISQALSDLHSWDWSHAHVGWMKKLDPQSVILKCWYFFPTPEGFDLNTGDKTSSE